MPTNLKVKSFPTRTYPVRGDRTNYGTQASLWAQDVTSAINSIGSQYTYIMGSAAQVTSGEATHSDWAVLMAAVVDGDSIWVKNGTYTFSSMLDINKRLTIQNEGTDAIYVAAAGIASGPILSFTAAGTTFNNGTISAGAGTPDYAFEIDAIDVSISTLLSGSFAIANFLATSGLASFSGIIRDASAAYLYGTASGGANINLSNLNATTAVNESLVSDTNNTDDLGTDAKEWKDIYTHSIKHGDAANPALNITTTSDNGNIVLDPHGTGTINTNAVLNQTGDVNITGNTVVSGTVSAGGYPLVNNQFYKTTNYFTLPSATNTSYTSTTSNNPYGFFFDDGKARYGCERIHFMGLVEIKDKENMPMYDTAGKKGYHPIDQNGKIRYEIGFYGSWKFGNGDTYGFYVDGADAIAGDYVVITTILNKINIMNLSVASQGVLSIWLDGADTTTNLDPSQSAVLGTKSYNSNAISNINIGVVSQGIHTIKLVKDSTTDNYFYGIEIVNEANSSGHELNITASTQNIKGKEVSFSAYTGANALPVKGTVANSGQAITGTKGGFVGYYADENGYYVSKVQEPTAVSQAGTINDNGAASDSITVIDSTKFYANSQGNIIRVKDATDTDRMLLVPTAAADGTHITVANDYDGVADTTLFAGNKQFRDDGTTGVTFANAEACTVELYAKIGANADHTYEELYTVKAWDKAKNKIVDRSRTVHYGDFGNQRSDDFTSITGTTGDFAFTMDDGCTTLVGEDCQINTGANIGSMGQTGNSDWFSLTFFGTGLDIEKCDSAAGGADNYEFYVDGIRVFGYTAGTASTIILKICSDLPLGFHTFKFNRVAAATFNTGVYNFLIYKPKKPALTDNYEYSFFNYVLADYVKTNLPTLNLSAYNGAIDQGVIRKANNREWVYSGTWAMATAPAGYTQLPCWYLIYSGTSATNTDSASINIFASGNIRYWHGKNATVEANYRWRSNGGAWNNVTSVDNIEGQSLSSSLTEGLNILDFNNNENATSSGVDCLDYHAPVFNQFYNLANPFPDYLMGQTGVLDNRKLVAYDEEPKKRNIRVKTTLTGNPEYHNLYPCSICYDFEEVKILTEAVYRTASASSNSNYLNLTLNGVAVLAVNGESISSENANGFYRKLSISTPSTLQKRGRIQQYCSTGVGPGVTVLYSASEDHLTIEEK